MCSNSRNAYNICYISPVGLEVQEERESKERARNIVSESVAYLMSLTDKDVHSSNSSLISFH